MKSSTVIFSKYGVKLEKTDNKIADFCDELDIKPPF